MLRNIQAYYVSFFICLFRPALTAAAIYPKTAEAKLYIWYKKEIFYTDVSHPMFKFQNLLCLTLRKIFSWTNENFVVSQSTKYFYWFDKKTNTFLYDENINRYGQTKKVNSLIGKQKNVYYFLDNSVKKKDFIKAKIHLGLFKIEQDYRSSCLFIDFID